VDRVHEQNLLAIEKSVAGGSILDATRECIGRLSAVAIDKGAWKRRDKPVVGVAGDIYTRVNRFANQDLIAKLSAMGCEVWPSSFIVDLFDFGLSSAVRTSLHRREVQDFFQKGSLLLLKEMSGVGIKNLFRGPFRPAAEPPYEEVVGIAAPYVGERANQILMLNTAKMVDFARKGVDGIINAVCFNCMVGSVSAAIISRLRKDHGNVPVVNMVFGEAEGASQELRLEAFVHQVKTFARRKKGLAGCRAPGPGI
jgi:predicted nucleotide-binding protein (sugar kinase/HSP70/actin superfamily)